MALLKRLLFDVPVASWDTIAHLIFAIIVQVRPLWDPCVE